MKGVVDKDFDLEVDELTDGKPVEMIPHHRSDMVELLLFKINLSAALRTDCSLLTTTISTDITLTFVDTVCESCMEVKRSREVKGFLDHNKGVLDMAVADGRYHARQSRAHGPQGL